VEGRVAAYPGAQAVLGAEVLAKAEKVFVFEQGSVKKGELLVEFTSNEERAALAEARARVSEAEADVRFFDKESDRQARLLQSSSAPASAHERALRDKLNARAKYTMAQAAVQRAEAALEKRRLVSPIDGTVIFRNIHPGETVNAGAPLLTVADLSRVRVEAELDEYDASRVKAGASVSVSAEGYGQTWKGKVEEIPSAVAARRLRPQDPGKPTDTRVVLLKVALEESTPLKLGQRVEVTLPSSAL
jgi:RND family efflux transporter MFP subunit